MNRTGTTTAVASSPSHANQPGLILLTHPVDGPPAQARTGLASLELNAPIGDDTAFNVGSVAKQITAYLLIRAARDGLLALDRPVNCVLPRFRVPDVSIGELIQHQGGIRDAESLLSLAGFRDLDHYTAEDLLALAYRQERRAVEAGRFLYSNTGYLLLAEILRHIHGTGLQDIANQQVFTPLGMTSARFKNDPREVIPGAAASYQPAAGGYLHQQRPVTLPGPGSLWCTATDLDRWLGHLWHGWSRAGDSQLPFEKDLGYRPSDHHPFTYGPGLYADSCALPAAVFHYGHEQGFSAAVHVTRPGLRIVCLSNNAHIAADHVAASTLTDLARQPGTDPDQLLARALSSRAARTPSVTTSTRRGSTPKAEHTSLGTYICDEVPGPLRLTRSDGTLYLWRLGTPDRLTRTSPATYAGEGYILTLKADADPGKPPRSFILDLDRAPGLHYRSG